MQQSQFHFFKRHQKLRARLKKLAQLLPKTAVIPALRVSQLKKLKVLPSAHEVVVRVEVAAVADVVADAMKKIKLRVIQQVQIQMRKIQKVEFIVVDVAE